MEVAILVGFLSELETLLYSVVGGVGSLHGCCVLVSESCMCVCLVCLEFVLV